MESCYRKASNSAVIAWHSSPATSALSKLEVNANGGHLRSVTSYSSSTGILILEHDYLSKADVRAMVDINLLLENLGTNQTSVGSWVNVIGYVKSTPNASTSKSAIDGVPRVHIQAIVLWPTGPLDVHSYEACFNDAETGSDRNPGSNHLTKT